MTAFYLQLLYFTHSAELFLTPVEIEELHDFEEECVEDYWRRKQRSEIKQSELQLENMSVRLAGIQYCLDEVQLRQQDPRGQIHSPEEVLSCLDESQSQKAIVNAPVEKTEPNLQGNHLSWRKCGSGRFSANKLKSSTNDLHEGLDPEATMIAKDPLHLAEAVEWAELGGALLRRFHQVSMRTNEERIPLFPKTSATAAVEADGVTTIATTDSAGGTSQTSSATMEGACATRDVLIAAAKALKVATSEELALEVVDPNLNLDYTPLATSPNIPYFLSGSTTAQPASTVRVDSHHAGERALLEKLRLHWHHAHHH
ncbi:hypothetical protein ECG_09972 [Echinococcus granulosus]|nr:hypothetical protein ECG_09972 [Echinococcus granulosus]